MGGRRHQSPLWSSGNQLLPTNLIYTFFLLPPSKSKRLLFKIEAIVSSKNVSFGDFRWRRRKFEFQKFLHRNTQLATIIYHRFPVSRPKIKSFIHDAKNRVHTNDEHKVDSFNSVFAFLYFGRISNLLVPSQIHKRARVEQWSKRGRSWMTWAQIL